MAIELPRSISEQDIQKLLLYSDSIRYGTLTLIFQDGKLVRIEKLEKFKVDD